MKQAIALLIDLTIILSDRFREAICSIILDAYNKGGNYVKDDMYTWYMAKVDMFHSSPALAARTDQHNLDYIKENARKFRLRFTLATRGFTLK